VTPKLPDWSLAGFLLLLFLGQSFVSSLNKAPVGDAWAHYLFGQWTLGQSYSPERNPAWDGTMPVSALNVLCSRAGARLGARDAATVERVDIPSLVFARMPNMLFGAGILFCVWAFARTFIDRRTALLALLLGTFEPNLLGHSRFITTDVPAAFGFTIGSLLVAAFALRPSWSLCIASAVLLALAQLTKTSNLLLYPIAVGVILAVQFLRFKGRSAGRIPWGKVLVWMILTCLLTLVCLHFAYSGFSPEYDHKLRQSGTVAEDGLLAQLLPATYRATIAIGRAHNQGGHPAYLLGRHSTRGWWYYFPIAVLVKTALPLLLLAFVGAAAAQRDKRGALILGTLPGIVYLAVFCAAVHVNIGVRHVLPVYPALFLLAGYGASRLYEAVKPVPMRTSGILQTAALLLVWAIPAWSVVEAARIYPHYEGYFNQLVGHPCGGWKVLGDSNVAWGQDRWIVEDWARKQDRPVHVNPLRPTTGLIVVRADVLAGITPEMAQQFSWLSRKQKPVDCLTPGILIYDIR